MDWKGEWDDWMREKMSQKRTFEISIILHLGE